MADQGSKVVLSKVPLATTVKFSKTEIEKIRKLRFLEECLQSSSTTSNPTTDTSLYTFLSNDKKVTQSKVRVVVLHTYLHNARGNPPQFTSAGYLKMVLSSCDGRVITTLLCYLETAEDFETVLKEDRLQRNTILQFKSEYLSDNSKSYPL